VCYGLAVRIAGSRDEERRLSLTRICTQLGSEAAAAVARAMADADDRNHRRNLVNSLAGMGELGMRQAEQMVEDGTWQVVRNGVSILAEVGGEQAVEHLVQTLAHHNPKVRNETILALGKIGGETPTLLILNKLDDADAHVRASAARAMGTLGTERTVRNLLERLDEEHEEEVQLELLRALGQIGDPGAVPAIEKRALGRLFKKPPTPVRVAAYRALALIGTPHAKRLLEDAANDKDVDVRTVARSLLGRS
jgi:HEAT repeat protein